MTVIINELEVVEPAKADTAAEPAPGTGTGDGARENAVVRALRLVAERSARLIAD